MDIKIKSGDLHIFQVDNRYGVIQVIEKSKRVGYNVRVFCDLIDEIKDSNLNSLLESEKFYFIKDFYYNDLIKCNYKINKNLDEKINMPRYMRSSERKNNGDIVWFVIDVERGKVVKKFNSFDGELTKLSPSQTWGIEYIKKRWVEGFDLEKWNNKLLDIWYLEYLKLYEPNKLYDFNMYQIKNRSILTNWVKENRVSKEIVDEIEKKMIKLFEPVEDRQNLGVLRDKKLKRFILDINKLNIKYNFINTVEREELIDYINYILSANGIIDENDIIEKYRDW